MIYFISDTHFYHKNMAKSRSFTVEQMNALLIKNWNETVSESDDIYILGDLFYRASIEEANALLNTLNGKKHLVIGNHDKHFLKKEHFNKEHFQEISYIIEFNYDEYHFFLCHYPVVDWNRKRYESFHLYGHVHANRAFKPILGPQSLNLSVENIDYKPISINQVISIINKQIEDSSL
ncbi:metallophosphoesterase family protein [Macrococcus armenti]|uniref:Metallophosphoesterase family protein n=1 Tax=Macrococcus armenti TaxID=2875764 RepID=A0ABY3ZVJ8_9STAP|nr:metallophosphoesterase family protein [Macrococcus armenti]UOB20911.1 metallophosphoesterase family protein [Macrococcus armenti]